MRISIIVPVYNIEKWLPKCLDSVLSQTLKDFEVLCVDDGSTDGSPLILNEYAKRDARVKVVCQENAGAGSARNRGLDMAAGDYIVFMDPDDYYPVDDVLEKLYAAVTENGCEIAGGRLRQFTDDGEGNGKSWIGGDAFPRYGVVSYREYQSPYWYYCYIYSRELIEREHLRFPLYRRFQDPPFFIRAMLSAEKFYAIEDVVYCWRTSHKTVDWEANNCRLLREHLSGVLEVLRLADKNGLDKIFLKVAKQSYKLVDVENIYLETKDIFCELAELVAKTSILSAWSKFKVAKCFLRRVDFRSRLTRFLELPSKSRIIDRIGARLDVMRVNKAIASGRYKYVHLLYHDKFSVPFVEFLNRNFPTDEHLVLSRRLSDHKFPTGENVLEIRRFKGLDLKSQKIKKIICHSLFDTKLVDFLYVNKALLQKAYWAIWGGDLYNAPRDAKNDFVRKNFKGYIAGVDREYAIAKYGMSGMFYDVYLYHPIPAEKLDAARRNVVPHSGVRVQINNSSDESTLEIMETLSRFADRDLTVTTVLSYGQLQWKDEIIKRGTLLFGSRFEFIDRYMSQEEYAGYMASNDILVLNQPRQQAVGNTAAMLYMGKKVFIREEVSTYKGFVAAGMSIHSTQTIGSLSFDEFVEYNEKSRTGTSAIAASAFFDEESCSKSFREFLIH